MKFKNKVILIGTITIIAFIAMTSISLTDSDSFYETVNSAHIQRKLLLPKYREDLSFLCRNISAPVVLDQRATRNESNTATLPNEVQETLHDSTVEQLLKQLRETDEIIFDFDSLSEGSYQSFLDNEKRYIKRGEGLSAVQAKYNRSVNFTLNRGTRLSAWVHFHLGIQRYALYDPDDPYLAKMLHDIATSPIKSVEIKDKGTQIKLIITYRNGGKALFKPMRFPREQETLPNHFYFNDYERHTAEIAAFHLDRLLGFYRVPPHVGRTVHVTEELQMLSPHKFAKTFYRSRDNNTCFFGDCKYYCDSNHPVCGKPELLEGSFGAFLPDDEQGARVRFRNPWRRSYSKYRTASWEGNATYCRYVEDMEPYGDRMRLLNLVDTHVFDFLTGNLDRHHYETFEEFGLDTFLVHLDHGRGFGRSKEDYMDILAPIQQCCLIKYSTFLKLVKLYLGPDKLSDLMRTSLEQDPLKPILVEPHLQALDRRVIKILTTVYTCLQNRNKFTDVIINDR